MDIVKILAGSHLYGCPLETSDYDYKKVYLQSLEQLLYDNNVIKRSKNEEENSEEEAFPLSVYMQYLLQGQVITVDMLFAPKEFVVSTSETWEYITKNKSLFFSASALTPFAKYSKAQAYKYGDKKSKLDAIKLVKQLVLSKESFTTILDAVKNCSGISLETENITGIRQINVCGKKFGETTDFKLWLEPLNKLEDSFGERVRSIGDDGMDKKASYHALRIIQEAIELATTGNLTFPRPEKSVLLALRRGEISKNEVSNLIETAYDTLINIPGISINESSKFPTLVEASKQFVTDTQYDYIKNSK